MASAKPFDVGGQAVIEGVMMRSPRSFAVVCRRPSGEIVVKEDAWQPLWAHAKVLRWPVLRGSIVLLESLMNGLTALTFSADQQAVAVEGAPNSLGARSAAQPEELSALAKWGMIAMSFAFGLALFVGAPHLLAWGLGTLLGFDATSFTFHLADGVIKVFILVGYLAAISLMPDVKRVFQYHGAEHKSIYTYEKGLPLTVENARAQTRFHPRCGTSFLLIVVLVSIGLFAALLQGQIADTVLADHLIKIVLKIPLMFPIAGLAYEVLKISGRNQETSRLARAVAWPGLKLQHITTREPDDAQLEIALISIRKTLWRERQLEAGGTAPPRGIEVYASARELDLALPLS